MELSFAERNFLDFAIYQRVVEIDGLLRAIRDPELRSQYDRERSILLGISERLYKS